MFFGERPHWDGQLINEVAGGHVHSSPATRGPARGPAMVPRLCEGKNQGYSTGYHKMQ